MFNFFRGREFRLKSDHWIFGIIFVAAAIGLLASFVLTIDKFQVLTNPNTILACSINVVLDCSRVMQTWQASILGFPNTIIGLVVYPVIMLVAFLVLAGTKLPRWFFVAMNVAILMSTAFSYWLFFESLYTIQALCPWCLSVTFAETLLFSAITFYTLRDNNLGFKKSTNEKIQTFLKKGYYQMVVISVLVILVALVIIKFGAGLFA
jgi:uncharacterized membrane protein